jgi:hypothetical protein
MIVNFHCGAIDTFDLLRSMFEDLLSLSIGVSR